jgi:transcriptional regulator GlxA family with amidase domain
VERLGVGILIFDGVEVLDFAGPYEVFSRTRLVGGVESRLTDDSAPFHVFTVARSKIEVRATGGLRVTPDHAFDDAPGIDILVVPGGFGTRALLEDAGTLDWIREIARLAKRVTSVCTGALLLARVGLLRDRPATTHRSALDLLAGMDPSIAVDRERRVVFADRVVTSAGVSAGIDMALDLVEQLHGRAVADETAAYVEYPRHPVSTREEGS